MSTNNPNLLKPVLLTGDRPTGPLHLGHFVGSLKSRVQLQHQFDSFILIADMQAYTDNYQRPKEVQGFVLELIKNYLSVGLCPNVCNIFLQSQVPALFELTSYFSNLVSFDALKHNPTLKTELEQRKINNLGFISYPVSQAADILLFKAECVPVGEDQSPILELTNQIGRRFNELYKISLFPKVKGVYSTTGRLKGVDGNHKMGKSLNNAIYLKDSPDEVAAKVKKMYTDPLHLKVEDPGHIEGNVVFYYLDVFDPNQTELAELKLQYQKGGVADGLIKKRLTTVLNDLLEPIRKKRQELEGNDDYLKEVLLKGTIAANERGEETIKVVREIFSLKLK
jgi:tryptophanyl-tRNA synthetase